MDLSLTLLPGNLPASLAAVCEEDALALLVPVWLIYCSLPKKKIIIIIIITLLLLACTDHNKIG